jgi:hypothetical protein
MNKTAIESTEVNYQLRTTMKIHHIVLLLSFFATASSSTFQEPLLRHRILRSQKKETTGPPTPTGNRLTPNAINTDGNACSCSPTKFTFRLNLAQDCEDDSINENAGIASTHCTIEDGDAIAEETSVEPVRRLASSTPVEITSVQYLEFHPDTLEVMHTDDTYVNTTLEDGDVLTFYSASSYLPSVETENQEEYVPGGVSLIIYGKTEDGEVIRNRFYWIYDEAVTDCFENLVVSGIYEGDALGWVVVVSYLHSVL